MYMDGTFLPEALFSVSFGLGKITKRSRVFSNSFWIFLMLSSLVLRAGFRFSLNGNQPCLNLLFPTWTLDTRNKFLVAMFCVFCSAILIEGFSKLRHKVARLSLKKEQGTVMRVLLRWMITVLHGSQALFGYTLMLVTMTFSVELLLAVVCGLGAGYGIFFQVGCATNDDAEQHHVTTNPCCEFMTEESREGNNEEEARGVSAVQQPQRVSQCPCSGEQVDVLSQPLLSSQDRV